MLTIIHRAAPELYFRHDDFVFGDGELTITYFTPADAESAFKGSRPWLGNLKATLSGDRITITGDSAILSTLTDAIDDASDFERGHECATPMHEDEDYLADIDWELAIDYSEIQAGRLEEAGWLSDLPEHDRFYNMVVDDLATMHAKYKSFLVL